MPSLAQQSELTFHDISIAKANQIDIDPRWQWVSLKVAIPITETSDENTKKIPKVVFIENTEAWVEKYTDDALFAQMNELY